MPLWCVDSWDTPLKVRNRLRTNSVKRDLEIELEAFPSDRVLCYPFYPMLITC